MSLDLILGYTGLSSLGHAAYLGLGAYSVGILTTRHGARFWTTLVVGVLLADGGGRGLRPRRAARDRRLLPHDHPGARHGRLGPRAPLGVAHPGRQRHLRRPAPRLGLPWSLAGAGPLLLLRARRLRRRLRSSCGPSCARRSAGRLVGIRESESRMRTLGYHVWLHKYVGFVIAGGVGGFAGVFWAYYNGFVSPADLELATSVEIAPHGGARRPRHPAGPRAGRRGSSCCSKNLVSVYTQRWLLILGARLHRHHRLRARRHRGGRPAVARIEGRTAHEHGKISRALVVVALVARSALAAPGSAEAQKGPIKIGFLAPMTGGAAADRQGHGQRLQDVAGGERQPDRRPQGRGDRRGHAGPAATSP